MLFFKSKIDQLEEKQNKLIQKREDLKSKTAFKNSKIEAKITKLQEKAFANREYLDKFATRTESKLAKENINKVDYLIPLFDMLRPSGQLMFVTVEYAKNLIKNINI